MPITVHPRTQQAINKLRAGIASLRAQKKAVITHKKKLQDEKKALQTKTTELKKTKQQLEAQNTELKKTIEQLEEQVANLGTEVSHAWNDSIRLSDRLNDAETELANTQGQLEFERSLRD